MNMLSWSDLLVKYLERRSVSLELGSPYGSSPTYHMHLPHPTPLGNYYRYAITLEKSNYQS
jgi:hypothetical protein